MIQIDLPQTVVYINTFFDTYDIPSQNDICKNISKSNRRYSTFVRRECAKYEIKIQIAKSEILKPKPPFKQRENRGQFNSRRKGLKSDGSQRGLNVATSLVGGQTHGVEVRCQTARHRGEFVGQGSQANADGCDGFLAIRERGLRPRRGPRRS
ncbi:hypothetical protein K0M31_009771 [Melipona bicolor]|uniref:Uncharacterized protein n=1 Tax=Melipona bicolor TaxID=60889 RepID=A0AA40KIX2_9HYME|nr:hypothetical protein K0M31_009771 [Melipona bicolor]